MSTFLWAAYPYVCIGLFIVVPVIRMSYRPFGFSTRASGLFGKNLLGFASLALHWGLFLLLAGHLAGFLGGMIGGGPWITVFYWIGLVGGVLVLLGSTLALGRRLRVPEVRAMSQWDDYVIHLFLLALVILGLYQVLVHQIFGVAYTASAWLGSVARLQPEPDLIASATLISKLHILIALTFFAVFPFTKLVHFWTYPVNYFVRPYQSMRTPHHGRRTRWEFGLRTDKSWLVYGLGSLAVFFVGASWLLFGTAYDGHSPPTRTHDGRLAGYPLFVSQCARCHGLAGDGDGPGASSPTFAARPRDLTTGAYHFVSTDNAVASDADLARTIRHGLPAAGMPAFDQLSGEQVQTLVATLDYLWVKRPAAGAEIVVPTSPPEGASADRGITLFQQNCAVCHGERGRGDGAAAAGLRIKPANLAAGRVKGGTDVEALYWRISAGIQPAAMPGFARTLSPVDRYSLVLFLRERVLPQGSVP